MHRRGFCRGRVKQAAFASCSVPAAILRAASIRHRRTSAVTGPAIRTKLPADPEAWLLAAEEQPGSWWTDWSKWLAQFGGAQKAAPKSFGNAKYKVIEPAPGRYVQEKA